MRGFVLKPRKGWLGVPTASYYCSRCGHNHRYSSEIGRAHTAASRPRYVSPSSFYRGRTVRPLRRRGSAGVQRPQQGHKKPKSRLPNSQWKRRRSSNREALSRKLQDTASSAVVTLVFDPSSRYAFVADELLERLPWYRWNNRGHWLCRLLSTSSKAFDPGTYLAAMGKEVSGLLQDAGMPAFAAAVIGKSAAFGIGRLTSAFGTDQILLGLRVLILLVCPNFDRCPTHAEVCSHLLMPGVEDLLGGNLGGSGPIK